MAKRKRSPSKCPRNFTLVALRKRYANTSSVIPDRREKVLREISVREEMS